MRDFLLHTVGNFIKNYIHTYGWISFIINAILIIIAYYVIAVIMYALWLCIIDKKGNKNG